MKKKWINREMIDKLAGYGPYHSEKPTKENLARLADPAVPLSERIRLLQSIAGGPLHYVDVADILSEDADRVVRCKSYVLSERLTDNVAASFQFDFAAPRTQQEAIDARYGSDAISAHYTGLRAGRKALREAGIRGHAAELWVVQVQDPYWFDGCSYTQREWVIQDGKTRRWRAAKDDEWMSLQLVAQRPGSAREAIEIAFDQPFPNARCVAEVQDAALLEPLGGVAAEAWVFDEMDRYPTWAVRKRGGYWTLASFSWQRALNQAVQQTIEYT